MKDEWKKAFPSEPEDFHNKLIKTLNSLPVEREVTIMRRKKYMIMLAAVVALFGTLSVYAAIKWNDQAVKHFKADTKEQAQLDEDNYSNQNQQSVTSNDITVTLKQTIQDENLIYLLFNVTNSETITEDNVMNFDLNYSNGDENQISSMEWGFIDQMSQPETSTNRDFEIWIHKSDTFTSKSISIQFTGYGSGTPKAGADKIEKEGNWDFTIDTTSNKLLTYDINQTIMVDNCEITLSKLEISPLSYSIYYEEAGVKALEQATGMNIDQADTLTSLFISGIEYQDGSIITEDVHENSAGYENGYYSSQAKFSEVVDTNQIKKILIGSNQIEVTK